MFKRLVCVLICVVLLMSVCSCAFIGGKGKICAMVNGEEINASVYQYFLSSLKSQVGNVETIDGVPAEEYLRDKAMEEVVKLYVVAQKAQELDIKFDKDMQARLQQQIDSVKGGSDEKLDKSLAQYGLDEKSYRLIIKYTILQQAVMEHVQESYSSEEINDFYNNEMVNVQQIMLKTTDENNMPLPDDAIAQKKAIAQQVWDKIMAGESFADLKAQYNEDKDNTEVGYMVSKYSAWAQPFIEASLALEVDGVSGVVESSYGYHIIQRFNHVDNSDMFTSFQSDIVSCMFQRDVGLWMKSADVEYNDDVIKSVKY